jgi:hypothetical protein
MELFNFSKDTLESLIALIEPLSGTGFYTQPCDELSGSTIGQHTRHIIELYQCMLLGYTAGEINYDSRKRNKLIEIDINKAIVAIKEIQFLLNAPNKPLELICEIGDKQIAIQSNYHREALYNLEHCIHHQALIKVACLSFQLSVSDQFGVAPSTIKYKESQITQNN